MLAVDLPGHGRSSVAALTSVEMLAAWLLRVLETVETHHISLIGHSLGALVTLQAAADSTAIKNLVLMGCVVPMAVSEPLLDAARRNDHAAIEMLSHFGHAFAARLGCNPVAGVSCFNTFVRLMETAAEDVLFTDLNACNTYQGGLAAAARIDCPVTIIVGKEDRLTPPKAIAALLNAIGHATLVHIENSGHIMFAEQPEATHHALVRAMEL